MADERRRELAEYERLCELVTELTDDGCKPRKRRRPSQSASLAEPTAAESAELRRRAEKMAPNSDQIENLRRQTVVLRRECDLDDGQHSLRPVCDDLHEFRWGIWTLEREFKVESRADLV